MGVEELKRRVVEYWEKRAEDFQEQRLRELHSPLRGRWYAEMTKYLPMGRDLRILDLGTGTGFFSFLLSEKGNMVTGIDLVRSQILIAEGYPLSPPEIGLTCQEDVQVRGYAIQCRVTTEEDRKSVV